MANQQQTAVLSVLLNGEQAVNEISKLEKHAEELKKQLDAAKITGNKALIGGLEKDIKQTNKTIKALETDVKNVSNVLNNLSSAKPKELRATLQSLNRQLQFSDLKRGSAEWNKLQENIRRVKQELKDISAESVVAESRLSRMSKGFNKYFGIVASGIASITGLSMTFRRLSLDAAKMDDVMTLTRKATEMTKEEIRELNEDFQKMDTRTSREELNSYAEVAGRIGVRGKENIMQFVEAADLIKTSLGKVLGEDAIQDIAKLSAVFSKTQEDLKSLNLKEQILAVGNAITELGNISTANEQYMVNFASRLGGIGIQAGITMQDILGYGSVLDQNMLSAEKSATALSKFITKIMMEPAKFAKIAGIEVKDFSELLNTDVNAAIKSVLRALGEKGGLQQLAPMFKEMGAGASGAIEMITTLSAKINDVDEAQRAANQAVKDGVAVQEEFDITNNSALARLGKAKKAFKDTAIELGEKLNPVLLKSTNITTYIIKILPTIIDWFSKYGKIIINTTAAILLYTLAVNASIIADKLKVFWTDKVIFSLKKLWIMMLNNPMGVVFAAVTLLYTLYKSLNKELTITEQKQKALNDVNLKAKNSIAEQTVELERLLKIAKNETLSKEQRLAAIKKINEISPEHLGNLTLEEISTNKAKIAIDKYKESLMQAAIAKAAFDKIVELQQKKLELQSKGVYEIYEENTNIWQKFWAGLANGLGDAGYVNHLVKNAVNENKKAIEGIDAQIDSLQKISEKNYASTISTDTNDNSNKTNNNNDYSSGGTDKTAIQRQKKNDALKKIEEGHLKAMAEIKNKYLSGEIATEYEYNQKLLDQQDKYDDERKKKLQELLDDNILTDKSLRIEADKEIAEIDAKNLDRQIQQANKIKKIILDADPAEAEKQSYENRLQEINAFYTEQLKTAGNSEDALERLTNEKKEVLENLERQHQENMERIRREGNRPENRKANLELKRLDEELAKEQLLLAESHKNGLISERQYKHYLLAIELAYLEEKKKVNGLTEEQLFQLKKQSLEKQQDLLDSLPKKKKKKGEKEPTLEASKAADIAFLEAQHALGEMSEESYRIRLLAINDFYDALELERNEKKIQAIMEATKFGLQIMQDMLGGYSSYVQACQDAETAKINRKYDDEIKAAGNNDRKKKKIEDKRDAELKKVKAEYEDKSFKIQIAQALAGTALAAINAYSSAAAIPVVGHILAPIAAAAALAAGMMQVAAIQKQHEAAKAQYYAGGFTPSGPWDEPQGFVHSEEFVGNRFAVRNPAVRKVFNIVDEAQRNNTVSALTEKDFAKALDYRDAENRNMVNRFAGAVISSSPENENNDKMFGILFEYFSRNTEVTEKLNKKLDEPFVGEVSITGKKGIKENLDLYDRMIANASRK